MTEKVSVKIQRLREKLPSPDGSELLTYSIDTPSIEGSKSFNEFYEKLSANCTAFCREKLILRCSPGSVYFYRLTYKTHIENDRLTVTLRSTFSDKTSHRVLSSHTETHKWNIDSGRMER